MKLVVKPLPGKEIPKFPNYRKNFETAYAVLGRIHVDSVKRGVRSAVGEMTTPRGALSGYIVETETDENGENVIIGTWSAE